MTNSMTKGANTGDDLAVSQRREWFTLSPGERVGVGNKPQHRTQSLVSIHFALTQDLPVGLARVFVILLGLLHFVRFDEALLLRPALIDSFQTPLRAAFRGAHRFVAHLHPNRVRV